MVVIPRTTAFHQNKHRPAATLGPLQTLKSASYLSANTPSSTRTWLLSDVVPGGPWPPPHAGVFRWLRQQGHVWFPHSGHWALGSAFDQLLPLAKRPLSRSGP